MKLPALSIFVAFFLLGLAARMVWDHKLGIVRASISDSLVASRLMSEKLPLKVYADVSTIHVDAAAGVDSIFVGDRLVYDATDSLRAFRIFGREYRVKPGFYILTDSALYSAPFSRWSTPPTC